MAALTNHRLPRWQRSLLFGAGMVLLATGAAWLAVHYGRDADALPSSLEPWAMRLHGLAGFAVLFMFGVLAAAHVPQGWRLGHGVRGGRQRGSGLALCALAASLALSGYLLYYFAPETVRPALGWLHSALGAAMALLVTFHRRGAPRRPRWGFLNERQSHSHMRSPPATLPPGTLPLAAAMSPATTTMLNRLPDGGRGIVARVVSASSEIDAVALRRLGELGFLPGEPVQLLRRGPGGREPLAVLIGETMFALRLLEAQCIEVTQAVPS